MAEKVDEAALDALTNAALMGASRALASVGRAFICLDPQFNVLHASQFLDKIVGEGAARSLSGKAVEEVLGEELFGPNGNLRRALASGQRREGWRATLRLGEIRSRLVSITAAPFEPDSLGICDQQVAYIVMLRPAEEEVPGTGTPTLFSGVVATSQAMLGIFRLIEDLSHSEATVLLTGESGTGKEVVARAIHQHSPRAEGPFVAVNCGALPSELLESELFGHVRGAFTGAYRDRMGRFEAASNGTLFLDEIGDVPLHLQVKLLRVLQERAFERVGETRGRTSNARIIAATNVDLKRAVAEGRFRDDLFYRLRVVPIEIPPLRERREDVQPLASFFLARMGQAYGRVKRMSPQAMKVLLDYTWPGNVRELTNAIEYAVAVAKSETILPEDLPKGIARPHQPESAAAPERSAGPQASEPDESARLRAVLDAHRWRRDEAARTLGISRTTLWRKMREFRLG